ncbi:hypothetical protein [Streptomyces sp. NPDC059970]|uniref:hypothetical protein n=1 Tax=Streptomyces sp. NPDC059970 TaxID=3347019 RepID=UPI0036CDC8BE
MELSRDRLAEEVVARCRNDFVEPPAPAKVRRLVGKAVRDFDTRFCRTTVDRLSHTTRSRLEDLVAGSEDGDETAEDQAVAGGGRSFFTEPKAPLRLADLDLERRPMPRVRVGEQWYPIVDAVSRRALTRWKATHQALTAGHLKVLRGGNVEELWVTTAPGRPRGGQTAPPAGLPAAVRTLAVSHRKLTSTALGAPLLLEQFCPVEDDEDQAQPGTLRVGR